MPFIASLNIPEVASTACSSASILASELATVSAHDLHELSVLPREMLCKEHMAQLQREFRYRSRRKPPASKCALSQATRAHHPLRGSAAGLEVRDSQFHKVAL